MQTLLLCSDLDRTLIPNGAAPESPAARPLLARLAALPQVCLAYVTGRDKALVREAIDSYRLPVPNVVIGDVGATLYHVHGERWDKDLAWQTEIGREWEGRDHEDVIKILENAAVGGLELQPPEKQNRFKVSYYADPGLDLDAVLRRVGDHLEAQGIRANIISSWDDDAQMGLVDILPSRANKLLAIRFLMNTMGIDAAHTVFAGDSGNDLDVLTSGLQAILVGNAADDIRQTARRRLSRNGSPPDRLYLARGGFKGLNGNYAAGVIEGVVHFFPEAGPWLQEA